MIRTQRSVSFIIALTGLLSVVMWGSVAYGDLLVAPRGVSPHQPTFASGSLGAARQWTSKREFFREGVHLPYKEGKIRFIPPEGWKLGQPLPRKGRGGGFLDKFGNEWRQGASRTAGEAWEWDVQLGKNATPGMKWFAEQTTGKGYVNISWLGAGKGVRHP